MNNTLNPIPNEPTHPNSSQNINPKSYSEWTYPNSNRNVIRNPTKSYSKKKNLSQQPVHKRITYVLFIESMNNT